jgi:hypothetical protein
MKAELETYIHEEKNKKLTSWRVDFGEEAKIETENRISTMIYLHNN